MPRHYTELTSAKQLKEETDAMNHCVVSYIEQCVAGRAKIWSLFKLVEGVKKKILTIQLSGLEIWQVRGNYNRAPNKVEIGLIRKWAKMMEYKLSLTVRRFDFGEDVEWHENQPEYQIPF